MFLLPWLGCPNLCRMADQAFDSQFFHEVHEPLHRSRGFDSHTHRAWKLGIKLPHVVAFVRQSYFHELPRVGVQHCHCLLASMQITSYNSHLGLLRSERCWGEHRTVYSGRREAGVVMASTGKVVLVQRGPEPD